MSIGLDPKQFRQEVVRPTLVYLGDARPNMENLLVGTASQESGRLRYLRQLGGGPALGIFQIEPFTHHDQWETWLRFHRIEHDLVLKLAAIRSVADVAIPDDSELIYNLPYACAIAWCKFRRAPGAIPAADDYYGLANYWKKHYNTQGGGGKIEEWVSNYPY